MTIYITLSGCNYLIPTGIFQSLVNNFSARLCACQRVQHSSHCKGFVSCHFMSFFHISNLSLLFTVYISTVLFIDSLHSIRRPCLVIYITLCIRSILICIICIAPFLALHFDIKDNTVT